MGTNDLSYEHHSVLWIARPTCFGVLSSFLPSPLYPNNAIRFYCMVVTVPVWELRGYRRERRAIIHFGQYVQLWYCFAVALVRFAADFSLLILRVNMFNTPLLFPFAAEISILARGQNRDCGGVWGTVIPTFSHSSSGEDKKLFPCKMVHCPFF